MTIPEMRANIASIETALANAKRELNEALIAEVPWKPGDILKAEWTTRDYASNSDRFVTAFGRVDRIEVRYGKAVPVVMRQLPSGKFHATQEWRIGYASNTTITKALDWEYPKVK